jgi:hypothetical protein
MKKSSGGTVKKVVIQTPFKDEVATPAGLTSPAHAAPKK